MPPPRLVKLTAGADYTGRNHRTVRRWIDKGYLTPYRLEGERGLFVDLDELDALPTLYPERVYSTYGNLGKDARPVVVVSSPMGDTDTARRVDLPQNADRIGPA